jgi:hypothetical protein
VFEGQRVSGGWTFIGDFADFRECGVHKNPKALKIESRGDLLGSQKRTFLSAGYDLA